MEDYRVYVLKKINGIKKGYLGFTYFLLIFTIAAILLLVYYHFRYVGSLLTLSSLLIFIVSSFIIWLPFHIKSFFKKYFEVISKLSEEELETFKLLSISRNWMEKYLPSFIIYSGKIRVFKLFNIKDFRLTDLLEITINSNILSRGSQNYLVKFKSATGQKYKFSISSDITQRLHLKKKSIQYNPTIIFTDND